MFKFLNKKKGFTLIELLVVISIIGILAAFFVANFGGARQRARDTQRKSDLNQIKTALALYYSIWGANPLSAGGSIIGCGTNPPSACAWSSEWSLDGIVYMKILPDDPLAPAQNYSYTCVDGNSFTLVATLEIASDKDIAKSQTKCGTGSGSEYVVCQD